MPTALTGVELLEALLTYLEDHALTNGACACGVMMDLTADVRNPVAPTAPNYDPLLDEFEFACLSCQRKIVVRMEDLIGPPPPEIPEADWPICSICRTRHKPIPAALKGTCPECEKVSRDVGQIVGVREEEPIL